LKFLKTKEHQRTLPLVCEAELRFKKLKSNKISGPFFQRLHIGLIKIPWDYTDELAGNPLIFDSVDEDWTKLKINGKQIGTYLF
jgi:hypothetical protein